MWRTISGVALDPSGIRLGKKGSSPHWHSVVFLTLLIPSLLHAIAALASSFAAVQISAIHASFTRRM